MDVSPALAALEERLAAAARAWDEDAFHQAAQDIADHVDATDDPDAALMAFDELVEARMDGLAEADDAEAADLYGAVVQDFYDACGLPVLSAHLGLTRGALLVVGDHGAEAEQVVREALDVLSADDDPFYASGAILLGRAIAMQERLEDALPVLEEAAELGQQHGEPALVAEASDVLGTVFHDLGRNADAVRSLRRAVESWQKSGKQEYASESLEAVAAAEIGLASEAAGRERFDECEPHARRALDAAEGRNEVLAATASCYIGFSRLRKGVPREASDLIAPALEVLRPLEGPGADATVAITLGVLGEAMVCQSNVVKADRCFREGLDRARRAGDDEIAKFLLLQLSAISPHRFGLDGLLEGHAHLGDAASDPRFVMVAARNAGMVALRKADFATAIRCFEESVQLSRGLPGVAEDGMSQNAMLMLAYLADGRFDAAERCLAAVDDALRTAHEQGEVELIAAVPPYLEIWHGVMLMARGDQGEASRRLDLAREQFQAAGATMSAVMVSALRGAYELHRGRAAFAVQELIPAALAAKSELVTLPSSAERTAFRNSYFLIIEVAVRASATIGDRRLMAELLEELQAQSIPRRHEDGTEFRSLSALMHELQLGLASPPDRAAAGEPRADAEQDTTLAPSARIRMPWDTIALESYHDGARRYGDHVVTDTTVALTILR